MAASPEQDPYARPLRGESGGRAAWLLAGESELQPKAAEHGSPEKMPRELRRELRRELLSLIGRRELLLERGEVPGKEEQDREDVLREQLGGRYGNARSGKEVRLRGLLAQPVIPPLEGIDWHLRERTLRGGSSLKFAPTYMGTLEEKAEKRARAAERIDRERKFCEAKYMVPLGENESRDERRQDLLGCPSPAALGIGPDQVVPLEPERESFVDMLRRWFGFGGSDQDVEALQQEKGADVQKSSGLSPGHERTGLVERRSSSAGGIGVRRDGPATGVPSVRSGVAPGQVSARAGGVER